MAYCSKWKSRGNWWNKNFAEDPPEKDQQYKSPKNNTIMQVKPTYPSIQHTGSLILMQLDKICMKEKA